MGHENGEQVDSAGGKEGENREKRKKEKWQRITRPQEKKKIQAGHSCLVGDLQSFRSLPHFLSGSYHVGFGGYGKVSLKLKT